MPNAAFHQQQISELSEALKLRYAEYFHELGNRPADYTKADLIYRECIKLGDAIRTHIKAAKAYDQA